MNTSHDAAHRVGRRLWRAAALGAVGAGLAGAASATANPTLAVSRPCVTPGEELGLSGSGFTPNGPVQLVTRVDSPRVHRTAVAPTPIMADATGALPAGGVLTFDRLVSSRDTEQTVTLIAHDQQLIQGGTPPGPATSAVAAFTLSIFDLDVRAWNLGHINPRSRATFLARGFEPAQAAYLFYVLRGRVVKRVRLGALTGPCGNLRRTMRQFPFRPVPPGEYSVYVSDRRSGRPNPDLLVYRHLRVTRGRAVR